MNKYPIVFCCAALVWSVLVGRPLAADDHVVDVARLAATVRQVGHKGAGHRQAIEAMRQLVQADMSQLPELLAAMDQANPLATNWLRAAVETVVQRQLEAGKSLPVDRLERFLRDRRHAPRARRLAFELISQVDPTARRRLIPGMLNDPSLELRRDAVAWAIRRAEEQLPRSRSDAIAVFRQALSAARDLDQIEQIARKLKELGQSVDLAAHFGFILRWHLVGPFDNTDDTGFDLAYGPEERVDFSERFTSKSGEAIGWFEVKTDDPYGLVDLNKVLGRYKGAVAYAAAEFYCDRDRPVDVRLGCINANKVWLNGQLVMANHVYHANTGIDQYVGQGKLQRGRNVILVKICQNEQTESWAQRWQFQLRVCDQYGTAIHSLDRPAPSEAAGAR